MKEYLTDLEIAKIEAFCKDKDMHEAVRKVLLQALYTHGTVQRGEPISEPTLNFALSIPGLAMTNPIPNEEIGAQVRAVFAGINVLKNAFDALNSIKTTGELIESPYNEAI